MMEAEESILCRGHPAISGMHPTTFEVTREEMLSPAGDCIIGVAADKGAAELSPAFTRVLADDRAYLHTTLTARGVSLTVISRGSGRMTFDHPTDLVWRTSSFICGRTVGIFSDYAARSMPRELISALKEGSFLTVRMVAFIPPRSGESAALHPPGSPHIP
ncbi:MAG: DUF371 domain-containing protein [Methanomicrobiaceae archaeon]|nr:DUF371 domain-containing protein [Methanomicrobiaceae archaeon]